MNQLNTLIKPLTSSMLLLLVTFVAGCESGTAPILGGITAGSGIGGNKPVPGAPTGAIIPGAPCSAATGANIPTVTSSDPTHGNQLATLSTSGAAGGGKSITATFSLAMNPSTINIASFTLAPEGEVALIPASVDYDALTNVATLTTAAALLPLASYTAVITQAAVTNTSGIALACPYTWTFKTIAANTIARPVNLGLAAPFGVASAAGLTNAGISEVNGNVVLHPTAQCNAVPVDNAGGFGLCAGSPPGINGIVHSPSFSITGVTSAAIKDDLLTAYLSLQPANLPGAIVLGCGEIGSLGAAGTGIGCAANNTLPPGVYISATATSIGVTGILTLDGQGDANAQFFFQAPSTLTTAAGAPGVPGSEITLINGAKAENVWWWVGSSATLGTYAVFQGNILADTSITMGTGASSCGRLLAGAVTASGAFTFDENVVSVPGHINAPANCL